MKLFNLNELKMLLENQKKITAESWGTETFLANDTLKWKLEETIKQAEKDIAEIMDFMEGK